MFSGDDLHVLSPNRRKRIGCGRTKERKNTVRFTSSTTTRKIYTPKDLHV